MASKQSGKWVKRLIAALMALGLAGGGGWYWTHKGDADAAASTGAAYAEIVMGDVEDVVTAQGKLEPKQYVDVGAQVSGQIEKLYVEIGDNVKTGAPIAEIDPEVYESQVEGDEARLKTLEAQRAEKSAEVLQAQRKLERNRRLVADNAVSREVFEDAETALKVAQAQLQSLDAQIEEAKSTLEGNRANLGYTKIFAPMDGTVVSMTAREGETINANQTTPTIVQLADLDTMTVKAQVAEADITRLKEKMPVYFTTLGSQGRRWQGEVRQILPSPETVNDVVLYNVLVDVGNEDRQLMTGMTTQMFFMLGEAKNVPVIPASALTRRIPEQDKGAVQAYEVKVLDGRQVKARVIHIGLSSRTAAQVVEGLRAGERVVLPAAQAPAGTQGAGGGGMRRMRI